MGCWLIHPKTLKEAQSQHRGLQQEAPAKQATTPRAKTQGVPEEGGPGTWAQRGRGGGALAGAARSQDLPHPQFHS